MAALVSEERLPTSDPRCFVEQEVPAPVVGPRDVLVEVRAVSVNPADVKRRGTVFDGDRPMPIGYDAVGSVVATGVDVRYYAIGDDVYYAGDVTRDGSNAQLQAVDERIVGRKPRRLSDAEAAAMPLTSLTAWETLFDKFGVTRTTTGTLVVVAGAGGVGSVLIQLAKTLTGLTVVATASRPESSQFVRSLGADHVVDHSGDLAAAVLDVAPDGSDYIFSPYSGSNVPAYERIAKPFSSIVAIDGVPGLDLTPLMRKSVSWHWEWMFTRAAFQTADMDQQRQVLNRVADLLDDGTLTTTLTTTLEGLTAVNLARAHEISETNRSVGKTVVIR
jgi:zinc-binding alcohol dehydrogenase family protein